jgi:hypothetical protein
VNATLTMGGIMTNKQENEPLEISKEVKQLLQSIAVKSMTDEQRKRYLRTLAEKNKTAVVVLQGGKK